MKNFEMFLNENNFMFTVEIDEKGNKTFNIGICNGITVFCRKGTRSGMIKESNGNWISKSYKKIQEELLKCQELGM